MRRFLSHPWLFRWTVPIVVLALSMAVSFGVLRLRSASPTVDESALEVVAVESGPMICRVHGLGTLVPEDVRWLSFTSTPTCKMARLALT